MSSGGGDMTTSMATIMSTTMPPLPPPPQPTTLQGILTYLVTVVIGIAMIGMGCAVELPEVWKHVKKPTGVIVGVISQFIIMPVTALVLSLIFNMNEIQTLGLLIMGSCPGGSVSNLASHVMDGDMNLSITMTTASSILALGMLPLILFIFQSIFNFELSVPFDIIGITLAAFIAPIGIGIFIRYKFPRAAKIVLKVLSVFGIVSIIVIAILSLYSYRDVIRLSIAQYMCGLILPLIGILFGYGISSIISLHPLLYLHHRQRRTISFEIGIQNTQLAVGIIQLSEFTRFQTGQILLFPIIYFIFQSLWILVFGGSYKLYVWIKNRRNQNNNTLTTMEALDGNENAGYANVDGETYFAPQKEEIKKEKSNGYEDPAYTEIRLDDTKKADITRL